MHHLNAGLVISQMLLQALESAWSGVQGQEPGVPCSVCVTDKGAMLSHGRSEVAGHHGFLIGVQVLHLKALACSPFSAAGPSAQGLVPSLLHQGI